MRKVTPKNLADTRRRFMTQFAGMGLGATLVPGIVWAQVQEQPTQRVTREMVKTALKMAGIDATDTEITDMIVANANTALTGYETRRKTPIPLDVSPPYHFSALAPGITPDRVKRPIKWSAAPSVKRPANLEDVAFWPVRHLAELIKSKQVSSVELTTMYLTRLHRYNAKLNNVVTFLDDLGMAQAKQADADIAKGNYKGPLHGIPWGAKDIISVKGYKTTWGTGSLKDQVFDYDASVVEMLRDAGAVLIAKVTTGELAQGDRWFGGQTHSPWDPATGSSGSSAGPASATAAGCIGFGIGSETSGSILSPAGVCGLAGLRPTFGRISRHGVMALSWTQDRLGPLCRYAEDCAIVMAAIAKLDGRDMSVSDIPFNWDPSAIDLKKLRVGYIKESFDTLNNPAAKANAQAVLDTLTKLGVSKFIPMTIPENAATGGGFGVESAAFFGDMWRAGKLTGSQRSSGIVSKQTWLTPAVEYLQSQRLRMMMMTELAKATSGLDVYVVAADAGGGGGGRGPAVPGAASPTGVTGVNIAGSASGTTGLNITTTTGRGGGRGGGGGNANPAGRHSTMANAACYPAINVPNGFGENGLPTHAVFFAQPFGEEKMLALAKAYQDAAGHHLKKPTKLDA